MHYLGNTKTEKANFPESKFKFGASFTLMGEQKTDKVMTIAENNVTIFGVTDDGS